MNGVRTVIPYAGDDGDLPEGRGREDIATMWLMWSEGKKIKWSLGTEDVT